MMKSSFFQVRISNLLVITTLTAITFVTPQHDEVAEILDRMQNIYQNSSRRPGRFLFVPNDNSAGVTYVNPPTALEETYDFVIIGSGSSGAVIANRLSEIADWNILLLEVGEEASFMTDMPPIAPLFQFTSYNWNYLMEKQENVCLDGSWLYNLGPCSCSQSNCFSYAWNNHSFFLILACLVIMYSQLFLFI